MCLRSKHEADRIWLIPSPHSHAAKYWARFVQAAYLSNTEIGFFFFFWLRNQGKLTLTCLCLCNTLAIPEDLERSYLPSRYETDTSSKIRIMDFQNTAHCCGFIWDSSITEDAHNLLLNMFSMLCHVKKQILSYLDMVKTSSQSSPNF